MNLVWKLLRQHILVYLFEGGTTDELYLFATEVLMGSDIVE